MFTGCDRSSSEKVLSVDGHLFSGVLRINPDNPRYFTDDSGKAIYLTGSHTWANGKIHFGPVSWDNFDYENYLNYLINWNHNFIRLWMWEHPQGEGPNGIVIVDPVPFKRTGPGSANDGKPKFDLTQFNQAYFDFLRSRVIAARDKGIYISIMLFSGDMTYGNTWHYHPFNVANNINEIDADLNEDGTGLEYYSLENPQIKAIQKSYIRKIVDTVNDLDNVLYEIGNEINPSSDSTNWQYYMIKYIKSYESSKPKQHPVGMTAAYPLWNDLNKPLFNSPADWISPGGKSGSLPDYGNDPPVNDGSKVILLDTDHISPRPSGRHWAWKSFLRGYNPIYMDSIAPWPYASINESWQDFNYPIRWEQRKAMGYALAYAKKMNLKDMKPFSDLSSTSYCLANLGVEYLIYQPILNSTFSVKLAAGTYSYEWFNPGSGSIVVSTGDFVANGSTKSFTPPFNSDSVLYIYASSR